MTQRDETEEPVKYILFTNLQYVTVNHVRTNCSALLLEDTPAFFGDGRSMKARGFGPNPAWPVFDLAIPSLEYTLVAAASPHVVLTHDENGEANGTRPFFRGGILQIKDGPTLELITEDYEQDLDVETFEGIYGDHPIQEAWNKLTVRCIKYWHAPNMPTLNWLPVEMMRSDIPRRRG